MWRTRPVGRAGPGISADWNDYMAAIDTAFAGGQQADVIEMNGSRMAPYASRDLILPIDLEAYGVEFPELTEAGAAAATIGDTQHAIPFDIAAELINVNLDILGEAGVLAADGSFVPPTSPEDFLELCKTIKEKTGKQPFGLGFVDDMASTWLFMTAVWQQGGDFVTEDGSAPTLDTPEAEAALQFLMDLIDLGYVDNTADYATSNQNFLNGDVAMIFNGGWEVNNLASQATFDYYATDFPNLWGESVVLADSDVWTISRNKDDDPVRYRAALEFLRFLTENNDGWAQGTGLIPVVTEVLDSEEYRSPSGRTTSRRRRPTPTCRRRSATTARSRQPCGRASPTRRSTVSTRPRPSRRRRRRPSGTSRGSRTAAAGAGPTRSRA